MNSSKHIQYQDAVDAEICRITSSADFDWIRKLESPFSGPHQFEYCSVSYEAGTSYLPAGWLNEKESFILTLERRVCIFIYSNYHAGFTFDGDNNVYPVSEEHIGMCD